MSCTSFKINVFQGNCSLKEDTSSVCLYPSYFNYFCVLILIATVLPACLSYLCKTFFMVVITLLHCTLNVLVLAPALDCEESRKHWSKYEKYCT